MRKVLYLILLVTSALTLNISPVSEGIIPQTTAHVRTELPSRSRPMTIKDLPKVWQKLAWCESRWHTNSTSPSGLHHGYFQIHEGFFKAKNIKWQGATLAQQWVVAQYVYHRQGAKAWSCADYAGLK